MLDVEVPYQDMITIFPIIQMSQLTKTGFIITTSRHTILRHYVRINPENARLYIPRNSVVQTCNLQQLSLYQHTIKKRLQWTVKVTHRVIWKLHYSKVAFDKKITSLYAKIRYRFLFVTLYDKSILHLLHYNWFVMLRERFIETEELRSRPESIFWPATPR